MTQPGVLEVMSPRIRLGEGGVKVLISRTFGPHDRGCPSAQGLRARNLFRFCTLTGADPPRFALFSATLLIQEGLAGEASQAHHSGGTRRLRISG
jgi:hypothetical protein